MTTVPVNTSPKTSWMVPSYDISARDTEVSVIKRVRTSMFEEQSSISIIKIYLITAIHAVFRTTR